MASIQLNIEAAKRENTAKPIVDGMLALCAKDPDINQALSDHFHNAPADQWQSVMREIRAEMDEYRPQILKSVVKEIEELVRRDRPEFEKDQLEPLQTNVSRQKEIIKYVVTYIA